MKNKQKDKISKTLNPAALRDKLQAMVRTVTARLPGRDRKANLQAVSAADSDAPVKKTMAARLVKSFLTLLLVVLGSGVFYLAMILGQPQGNSEGEALNQPLLPASPAVHLTEAAQLPRLVGDFPIPVLGFMEGSEAVLTQGAAYDTAFEQGFARIISLTYQMPSGQEIQVQSIYPARAISLLQRTGYALATSPLYTFAGLHGVRMDSAATVRIHAQNSQGVYTVTYPAAMGDAFLDFGRGLRMFVPAGEE